MDVLIFSRYGNAFHVMERLPRANEKAVRFIYAGAERLLACEKQIKVRAEEAGLCTVLASRCTVRFPCCILICLPRVIVLTASSTTIHTTPSRLATTDTCTTASQRTNKPIAAHAYSHHDRTLITRHSALGLAPFILRDQTFSTGDDKRSRAFSTLAAPF